MRKSKLSKPAVLAVLLISLAVGTAAAEAELGFKGWGIRGGLSIDPDQFFVGGHLDLGTIVESVHIVPNLTVGFGDDWTIIALNPDFYYMFPVDGLGGVYFGGLFAFQYIKYDLPPIAKELGFDDSDTEVGLHVIGGVQLQSAPIMLELNIGLDDTPDLKAAIGYTFRND